MLNKTVPVLMLLAVTTACSSTHFIGTWRNPEIAVPLKLTKVAMVAITDDAANRRMAEDQMCAHVRNPEIECVRAYVWVPTEMVRDVDAVKAKFAEQGIDSAITLRVASVEQETRVVAPNYVASYASSASYAPFYGYYNYGWTHHTTFHAAGSQTVKGSKYIRLEANIYALGQGLVWSGITETRDPDGVRDLVDKVAVAAVKALDEQGILAKPPQ